MMKVMFGLILGALPFSTSALAYGNIHQCISTATVGFASVTEPGFAYRMRALRSQCSAASQRYEAAEIVWSQYDRAYECRVGWFCNSSGN